jgi:hypothetical protein
MDAPSKNYSRHNYCNRYYSTRLNGNERMYRREHLPLGCNAVHSFWQPGGVSIHCNRQCILWEENYEKFPRCWKEPVWWWSETTKLLSARKSLGTASKS